MNLEVEGFEPSRLFFDDDHFPHGFKKCGDFTVRESDLLSTFGSIMRDLHSGKCQPSNPIQARFIDICQGKNAAESPLEKVWLKYLDIIRRKSTAPKSRFATADTLAGSYIDDLDTDLDL